MRKSNSLARVLAPGILMLTAAFSTAACGDDAEESGAAGASGVDSSKQLLQLSMAETSQLCNWTISVQPAGEKTCPDGTMVTTTTATPEQCQSGLVALAPGCTATVADHERCETADDCDFAGYLQACLAVAGCQSTGSSGYEQVDCGDGTTGDKCDDFPDCANGADEMNCP